MKEIINIIKKSKLPWIWILIAFLINVFYNRILYMIPSATGKLVAGDLSSTTVWQAILSYIEYGLLAVLQAVVVAFAYGITTRRARFQLWGKMLKIDESYFDKVDSSEMLSAVTFDLGAAMPDLVNIMVAVLPDIYFVVIALKKIWTYDVKLLIVMLVFIPFKIIYTIVFGRLYFNAQTKLRTKQGQITSKIGERIENLPMVKSFNKEEQELEVGSKSIEELYKANVSIAKLGGLSLAAENGIELLQQFIVLVIAVLLLQKGKISMEAWIAFFLFTSNISTKISTLMSDWISIKQVGGNLARPKSLYQAGEEDSVADGKGMDSLANYDIEFKNVEFGYDEDLALKDVSFTIKEGQKVAIVGNCGSGKSTTLSLIERFYTPKTGDITIGGVSVSQLKLEDYRNQIAYVPQLNQVFSETIREVLKYGNKEELSDEMLIDASNQTGFSEYLKLQENGLDTQVTNGGDNMSGGQLQRMIITREYLRKGKIILFDEPTSALDAKSSRNVKDLLMNHTADKTVVVVTHDLSITDQMDMIMLLDNGTLLATGTYDELLSTNDKFRQLVESQNVEVAS